MAAGFGLWQSMPCGGEWQEFPVHLAEVLERAFQRSDSKAIFRLTAQHMGLRKGDPADLQYEVDFTSMQQICIENPDRRRDVRRVGGQDVRLKFSQQQAIMFAERQAHANCGPALVNLKGRLHRLTGDGEATFRSLDCWMRYKVPIIIHTQLSRDIGFYLRDTHYRNFWETGTGRGSTDTGARGGWEERFFGKAFEDCLPTEKPKYGCLNLTNDPKGVSSATQYGTSYFIMKHSIRWRVTITSRDSSNPDARPGTLRQFARFLQEGEGSKLTDGDLMRVVRHRAAETVAYYKEVQIHGDVRFSQDVHALVADEDLDASDKRKVRQFVEKNGFPVIFSEMHEGPM